MKTRFLPLLLAAALACTHRPEPQPPVHGATPAPATETNPALRISVAAGDTFQVSLRANVTTGYHWELADSLDARVVARVGHAYVADPNPRHAVGSGGVDHWTFRGVAPGATEIVLAYYPPGSGPPAMFVRYTVDVH
jgi:predicted secreted protein